MAGGWPPNGSRRAAAIRAPPAARPRRDRRVPVHLEPPGAAPGFPGHLGGARGYRMLMARAITSAARASDPAASSIMRSLAQGLIAEVSVGLNAMAVQKPSDR